MTLPISLQFAYSRPLVMWQCPTGMSVCLSVCATGITWWVYSAVKIVPLPGEQIINLSNRHESSQHEGKGQKRANTLGYGTKVKESYSKGR